MAGHPFAQLLLKILLIGSVAINIVFGGLCFAAENPPETEPVSVEETVVTATRSDQTLESVPAQVTILTAADVRRSAALSVDDFLRQTPAFSLFRRSSSIVAHPTTQGVSLRGIGASGASRTLVLMDGIPLNDPFGGWVQWNKISLGQIDRAEIARGGAAHMWGNQALGGVIYLHSKRPTGEHTRLRASGGNRDTADLHLSDTRTLGPWDLGLDARLFNTDGYPIVREMQRGDIDVPARSESGSVGIQLHRTLAGSGSGAKELSIRAGHFREERGNGTPLTQNQTSAGYTAARLQWTTVDGTIWRATGFAQTQEFESTFSRQEPDRSAESPALDQFDVPSRSLGGSIEWLKPSGRRHVVTAGTDLRWTTGATNEDFRNLTGAFSRRRRAGGDQLAGGVYGQELSSLTDRWQLTAGGRIDLWKSLAGVRRELDLENDSALLRDDEFADRTKLIFSPKVGVRFALVEPVSLRGAAYSAFRAPTLNELFRPFRVGNDITEANENLDPEKLQGLEVGGDLHHEDVKARFTAYWNRLRDGIFNLTIAEGQGAQIEPCGFVPQGGSCRQRQNVEEVRILGLEMELTRRRDEYWTSSTRYMLTHATIVTAPGQPALLGKRLPQVPRHRLVLQLVYDRPDIGTALVQASFNGSQFEDNANTRLLSSYSILDLFLSRPIAEERELFIRLQNLLDETYAVGETTAGLVTEGAPRLVSAGLRAKF